MTQDHAPLRADEPAIWGGHWRTGKSDRRGQRGRGYIRGIGAVLAINISGYPQRLRKGKCRSKAKSSKSFLSGWAGMPPGEMDFELR